MMSEPNDARPFVPERGGLKALREAAAGCRGCHLWQPATQTVFGEGRKSSRVMLVGEQPGDREDREGRPCVGPAGREIEACRPWLDEELAQVKPAALVVLGATAAKALLGASFRITRERGRLLDSELAPLVSATIHPSAILRAPDEERHAERQAFADDLRAVAKALPP